MMNNEDPTRVRELLAAAQQAQEAGARAGARPAWYPPALGVSVALALASFAVPWLTVIGVVLGAVILPLVIEATARRVAGAAPRGDVLRAETRGPVLGTLVVVVGVTAGALVLLKATGDVWGVLVGAVVVGVLTAWCTWWVSRQRVRWTGTRPGRA